MNRDEQRQLDNLIELIGSIKTVNMIGTGEGDFYLEPGLQPELAAELAAAIKPVLIKHRVLIDQSIGKVGF